MLGHWSLTTSTMPPNEKCVESSALESILPKALLSKREENAIQNQKSDQEKEQVGGERGTPIIWGRFIALVLMHIHLVYSVSRLPDMKWQTIMWIVFLYLFKGVSLTAGVHRLWTHRAYKATLPLRIFYMIGISSCGMISMPLYRWVRDHRVHHKYTDTDLDPHNSRRGFLYCHIGWFCMKYSPKLLQVLRSTKMDDIFNDPVATFEKKYHLPLIYLFAFIVPTAIPMYLWQENLFMAYNAVIINWVIVIHALWSVNSFAHAYGYKPFNKNILSVENPIVSFFTSGEGWHNYHHMFPWDYKASEGGFLNTSMHFIKLCQRLGLAYDLKAASPELVKNVILKYGDGSHASSGNKIQEVPEEAIYDHSVIGSLPTPVFNKHQ